MRSQLVFGSRGVSDLDSEVMQTGVVTDVAECSLICPESSPSDKECVVEIEGKSVALSMTSQEMARLWLKVEATAPPVFGSYKCRKDLDISNRGRT